MSFHVSEFREDKKGDKILILSAIERFRENQHFIEHFSRFFVS